MVDLIFHCFCSISLVQTCLRFVHFYLSTYMKISRNRPWYYSLLNGFLILRDSSLSLTGFVVFFVFAFMLRKKKSSEIKSKTTSFEVPWHQEVGDSGSLCVTETCFSPTQSFSWQTLTAERNYSFLLLHSIQLGIFDSWKTHSLWKWNLSLIHMRIICYIIWWKMVYIFEIFLYSLKRGTLKQP